MTTVGVFSRGIRAIPHLAAFLGAERLVFRPGPRDAGGLDAVVGWGRRDTARRAVAYAARHGLPYWSLEDGFVRSLDLAARGAPPLSLVVDDLGVYYDATRPSRLEATLNGAGWETRELSADARRAIGTILGAGISKYNAAPDPGPDLLPETGRRRVLVVDQTCGDRSVAYGGADAATFEAMCAAALAENPEADVYAKLHPDALCGAKRGYLAGRPLPPGITPLAVDVNPIALLRRVDRVYVVTSQLGFEAALLGRDVVCFGTPFYAGWGFTDDRGAPCARRVRRRTVEEVFAAAYLRYARYVDPVTGAPCPIFPVLEHLARARAMNEANRGELVCVGFPRWKRRHVRPFLASTDNRVRFLRPRAALRAAAARGPAAKVVVWAAREPDGFAGSVGRTGARLLRVEDGFIRSCGLGSDLIRAHSLVVDGRGIYFDPSAPSDLEHLLQHAALDGGDLLARAARVRARIVRHAVSKYNLVGGTPWRRPATARAVILVPGQVADDASVRRGCGAAGAVADNLALLRAVRAENPDAYLVYKVHPDVAAGNRAGRLGPDRLARVCDEVLAEGDVAGCLPAVDEVHTMTSLAGFEGLLHGKRVVTYGGPFYAGWGLTRDHMALPRRTRRLTLDQLVAGALLLYPRYYDWQSRQFCACETVLGRLIEAREAANRDAAASAFRRRPAAPGGTLPRLLWRLGHYIRGFAYG